MVLVIAAALLAVILLVTLISAGRSSEGSTSRRVPREHRLPAGADAALWSIIEAVPDPRNHLALTRDLTGEVRISGTVLDPSVTASPATPATVEAPAASAPINTLTPPPPPVPAGGASVRIIGRRPLPADDGPADDLPLEVAS